MYRFHMAIQVLSYQIPHIVEHCVGDHECVHVLCAFGIKM